MLTTLPQVHIRFPRQSSAMKGRNENDLIPLLQRVFSLAFQLPIRIIDEDKDPWTSVND